jgi:MIP family channel proteins
MTTGSRGIVESNARAAVAEGIGTFALIFFGAGSVVLYLNGQLDLVGVALAHGLVIAIMVSQMAHLSGGAFNPAIQIALWVTGKAPSARTVTFLVAQLVAGAAAALLLKFLVPAQAFDAALGGSPTLGIGISSGKGILLEAVGTFFLVWAVFATIVDDRGPFGKIAGLPIGLTITFGMLAIGPWTGGAFNPARWFGPALASGHWDDWYVWIVGPTAGGVLAGVGYWGLFLRDHEPATP